ncbi:DNA ligase 1 [Eurosta solidaginis]|uniref:DNA ligase 1 n=1 Tax=Eurosta solidaginis TaxID=178769 RepID=UPI00353154AD
MSSSESEQSENHEQSDADEEQNIDINASNTDSDDDNDNEEDIDIKPKSLREKVAEQLQKKYSERQGKQLHIRFPHKLPEDEDEFQSKVKALSSLIVNAHKPRQKHARFCLVDFNSSKERDMALQTIKASAKSSETKIIASIPRTESLEFIDELVQRKVNALEKKKAKAQLRRASKLALRAKNFTSSIVITNLPQSASVSEVRRLFPTAVDVQIKPSKHRLLTSSIAAITLPTTLEARAAVKKEHSLGGTKLIIRFDNHQRKKFRRNPLDPNNIKDAGSLTPIIKKKNADKAFVKVGKKQNKKKLNKK